jgi:hypothetical protein
MISNEIHELLCNDLTMVISRQSKNSGATLDNHRPSSKFASMFTSQEEFREQKHIEVPALVSKIKIRSIDKEAIPAPTQKRRCNLRS